MPTPVRYFIKVAQEWGNIDPDDYEAVENWYINELPKLPKKDLRTILDELVKYSNEKDVKPEKIVYPSDIPLPLMKDIIPANGLSWINTFNIFLNYVQNLLKPNKNR